MEIVTSDENCAGVIPNALDRASVENMDGFLISIAGVDVSVVEFASSLTGVTAALEVLLDLLFLLLTAILLVV